MFFLEGNEINVTKGDTAVINFGVDNYNFVDGDVVHFAVKKYTTDNYYVINKTAELNGNIATIYLSTIDTKIDKGIYWYDIQCSLADGRVDTVVNKERFVILEEIYG